MSTVHITPKGDIIEHDRSSTEPTCVCGPRVEFVPASESVADGWLIIHEALDGRDTKPVVGPMTSPPTLEQILADVDTLRAAVTPTPWPASKLAGIDPTDAALLIATSQNWPILAAEVRTLAARIDAIRAEHEASMDEQPHCLACGEPHPCTTTRLTEEDQ